MNSLIFALVSWLTAAAAQDVCYAYSSSAITECEAPITSTLTSTSAPPDPTKTITVTMPECRSASCEGCTYTRTYTKTGTIFHPTGTACQTWTVKEVYPGVSTSPVILQSTGLPDGFTTTVATCTNTCGASKVTATLEYPTGGKTFTTGTTGGSTSAPPVPVVTGAAATTGAGLSFVAAAAMLFAL